MFLCQEFVNEYSAIGDEERNIVYIIGCKIICKFNFNYLFPPVLLKNESQEGGSFEILGTVH